MFQYFDIPRLQKLLTVLQGRAIFPAAQNAQPAVLYAPGKPDFTDPARLRPFPSGERWGGDDADAWFRTLFTVPPALAHKPVWLEVYTGREDTKDVINPQLLVFVNGRETQGIDRFHPCVCITQGAAAGEVLTVDFDAWFGLAPEAACWTGGDREPCRFAVRAFVRDEPVEQLYWDIKTPCDVASLLPADNSDRLRILKHLTHAVNLLDLRDLQAPAFTESVQAARDFLEAEFYTRECAKSVCAPTAHLIGHTHIDVAWLWAFRHTRRKAARSFATALALIEQYPDYLFLSSQPQLYAFLKEEHPALYTRVQEQVRAGRWVPDGAMWLEADCNLSSGEALLRQIVYGKRFFREEFATDSRVLWLPDVFGYAAALPQICKLCGVDYFMTTKISWNDTNQIPNDTFYWHGLDGSRVLTHFIPTRDYDTSATEGNTHTPTFTTYNGELSPNQVMGGWKRYGSKDISNEFLVSYGYGDGGGGTTREMLEQHQRMQRGIPGCPKTKHTRPLDFFTALEQQVQNNPRTPTWHGELYFEYHRGTYTSVAKTKQNNRKAEFSLLGAELACVLAWHSGTLANMPTARLQALWKLALTNQFHDILPGSSITQVYREVKEIYADIFAQTEEITRGALQSIADGAAAHTGDVVVFNALGAAHSGVVLLPEGCDAPYLRDTAGNVLPVQDALLPYPPHAPQNVAQNGAIPAPLSARICHVPEVPPMGYLVLTPCGATSIKQASPEKAQAAPEKAEAPTLVCENGVYTNGVLCLQFNAQGCLASVYDSARQGELLPPGKTANALMCYEDRPHAYDAWDLNVYHKEHAWQLLPDGAPQMIENGPVRAVLRQTYHFLSSTLRQDIVLYPHSRRIDFMTVADWQQDNVILKAEFPVDVFADKATFDVQFGAVERPTHTNTSWDFAKFETCAHKWADLSEDGYGVSLLSESKYGFDVHDGVLRLSLLRSPSFPAQGIDKGVHCFTYALYPHDGGLNACDTRAQAEDLNRPLTALAPHATAGKLPQRFSAVACSETNIAVEVLKPAENGRGVIVRAHERFGRRTRAVFTTPLQGAVCLTDGLEQPLPCGGLSVQDGCFAVRFRPYEIKTIWIDPSSPSIE